MRPAATGAAVVHPPVPARSGAARATTWWGKAWVRAVEETAYTEGDLRKARALARAGGIGGVTVDLGTLVASVPDDRGLWTASVTLPVLDDAAAATLVEVIGAQAGRIGTLLAGDLPHDLVEHAEEGGVELLPYGGELDASCTCEAWLDPCVHALAVMYVVAWLLEADPFVLLHLRGLPRDRVLAELHRLSAASSAAGADGGGSEEEDPVLETAVDAALRARRILELLPDAEQPVDHLF